MKTRIIIFSIIWIICCVFNISYAENNEANLKILRLDIEGIEPTFKKDVYKYYLVVPTYIENISIEAIPQSPEANVKITGNTNLQNGLNIINIEVSSKDQELKSNYIIEVTKTDDKQSANSNLETLAIKDVLLNPPFDVVQTNYETEVSNNVINLDILAIPENENSNILIQGKDNLKIGNNLVTINVIAPNGFTKKNYQINVKRRNKQEELEEINESEQMQQKLENAYKIERMSMTSNKEYNKKQEYNNILIIIGLIVITLAIIAIFKNKSESH